MKFHSLLCAFLLSLLTATTAPSASWCECNGTPVRPKYPPMGISWDLYSIPSGSDKERAFFSAMFETRNYVTALGFGAGFERIHNGRHIIEHDNDRSDIARVNRSDIDGANGTTVSETDGCVFPWEDEHIITADVMIAGDLTFRRTDESTTDIGNAIGAFTMLHELGHALGLEHSSVFAVMRPSPPVPFVGMTPGSGGLSCELVGDDVFGIARIYGYDPVYRNVFVSSQLLLNGTIVDNDIDPTKGNTTHPNPVLVCPGDQVNFYVTVGNNSSTREQFQVAVYADSNSDAYYFSLNDALVVLNVSLGRGDYSFPVKFTVPASLPVGVAQNIYVSISGFPSDKKGYDNAARSRLRIQRKAGC